MKTGHPGRVNSDPAASRCVIVDVARGEVDEVSGLFWAGGATAVQELDLGPGRVRLVAGIPTASEPALGRVLGARWRPDFFDAGHDGWLDAWRPFARPVRVGRVVVHPPWEPVEAGPGDLLVPIDPCRSFGQGNHPSTRLVLDELQRHLRVGDRVLDVGCGSGVLGIVALRLGASTVVAVDVEDDAVATTRENARRNGVEDRLSVTAAAVSDTPGDHDLVVANILAPTLIELAPDLVDRTRPGGLVILSGLLAAQRDRVLVGFERTDLIAEEQAGEWVSLVLRRG